GLHRARSRARAVARTHRPLGRPQPGAGTGRARLRLDRGRASQGAACGSAKMSAVETWIQHSHAQAERLPGAKLPWLLATRNRALERFAELGWPTNKLENWRHTSLAMLEQQEFVLSGVDNKDFAADAVAKLRQGEDGGHWLVFVDGHFAPTLSD